MLIKRLVILTAVLLLAAVAVLIVGLNSDPSDQSDADLTSQRPADSGAKPATPAAAKRNPSSQPGAMKAPPAGVVQNATPTPPPTSAEPVEEAEEPDEQAQVAAALAQLYNASDVSQRIEGAEQLGAYPTPEAESALAQVLGSDSNADVRSAAAQSLGYVEKPTDTTLNALAGALEDQNEEVRMNALSTLEDFLLGADEGSSIHNKVLTELKSRKASQTVPKETREAIKEILEDQASNAQ